MSLSGDYSNIRGENGTIGPKTGPAMRVKFEVFEENNGTVNENKRNTAYYEHSAIDT